ncbi:MAG: hypothetical protein ACOYMK_15695, partial [Hyphomonadaceae bacterium]
GTWKEEQFAAWQASFLDGSASHLRRKSRATPVRITLTARLIRLVGAILPGQNDEWAVRRSRDMALEAIAPMSDDPLDSLPALPAA